MRFIIASFAFNVTVYIDGDHLVGMDVVMMMSHLFIGRRDASYTSHTQRRE
jgi:hypothetical protein